MLNRKQRRAGKSYHARNLKNAIFDTFVKVPDAEARKAFALKKNFKEFWKNSVLSVQTYDCGVGVVLAGVRRHDQKTNVSWRMKQNTKNEIFGKEAFAVEVFPPEGELVDQANIYWLWVFDSRGMLSALNIGKYLESWRVV